ncbi:RNA polymerase sigma factor [Vagococcus hydrophili]|uniref:RNA polymerase sigma factor n=1 Tax=Vagococcus hydrophili TaxID=2714947 RepID=A0A6G8AWU2_9ENTE|nr:RNA polymerase sigma factor [Vagococcus hydrophili]QIL49450.1 RNA polymerase sigma factor [Vagococcus hydrophili]
MDHLDIDNILETYSDMVYRIAYTQMKSQTDAEDVYQEVFLRLVKNYKKIKSEAHLKHWLIRVTINCCYSQLGSSWNKHKARYEDNQSVLEPSIKRDEELDDLLEACHGLNEKDRMIIHLHYFEGYALQEIADFLEMSLDATKKRLSRARQTLKKEIGGDY